ncbi:hypothetical protein EBN03_08665 [Nocardia stercoris]|uniref:Uncharacterized protein n=1 Tax=Nocardia stercoris TaxID=2483361 RepID=A0A3M2L981_9NOCA|nr:hypothetical protein EBN03_08665 [Nocardia stercoris]
MARFRTLYPMSPACPVCSWPAPMAVSAHNSVRYLRCVCGSWLVAHGGGVDAVAGPRNHAPEAEPEEGWEPLPLPEM